MFKNLFSNKAFFLLAVLLIVLLGVLVLWKEQHPCLRSLTAHFARAPKPATEASSAAIPPADIPLGQDSAGDASHFSSRQNQQSTTGVPSSSNFQLLSATPAETRFSFQLADIETATIDRPDGTYTQISAGSDWFNQTRGTPAVPIFQAELLLPDGLDATLEIVSADFTEYPTLPVIPASGLAQRQQPLLAALPDFAIYNSATPFPASVAVLATPYRLRRTRGATVIISPVQYLPQQGILRVHHRLELALRADSAQAEDYPSADQEWNSRAFQYRHFLNSSLLRSPASSSPGTILLIRPDAWDNVSGDFLSWKSSLGFQVEESAYPSDTGTDPQALRSHLLQAYEERGLTHVIICGDQQDVPPWQLSPNPNAPGTLLPTSDTYYAFLDGDDLVPDVFLSRIPAVNVTQLGNILNKFIAYEAEPPANDTWRQQAIFLASEDFAVNSELGQQRDSVLMGQVRDSLVQAEVYPYEACTFLAKANATTKNLRNAFNQGAAIMLYLGHGTSTALTTTGFNTTNAVALSNNSWLPFILSPVCDNGNFAYLGGDCLAEAFLHATDGAGSQHGGIAILAATSNTYWDPPIASIYQFRDDLINANSGSRLTQFGAYSQAAVMAGYAYTSAVTYWQPPGQMRQDNTAEYYAAQMHLFGDCSMVARLRPLRQLQVTSSLIDDGLRLSISLTWEDGTPVPGAQLSLANAAGELLYTGFSDSAGTFSWLHEYAHQHVSLTVHDPSARLHVETIDLNPPAVTHDLKTIFTGIGYLLKLLPDTCVAGTITDIIGLPPGMSLSQDGFLQGIPNTTGNYQISFLASTPQNAICQVYANVCVLTQPDKNQDGLISNQELLSFLQEWQEWQADEETKAELIERWVQAGTQQNQSRHDEDKPQDGTTAAVVPQQMEARPPPTWRLIIAKPATDAYTRLASTGANIVAATDTTLTLHGDQSTLGELTREGFTLIASEAIDLSVTRSNSLYPSPEEINEEILTLARQHSQRCRPSYIGTSTEGREILGLRLSDDVRRTSLPQLLIIGAIHGDERPATVMALRLAQHLLETAEDDNENGLRIRNILTRSEIYIVPTVNPDGVARGSRYNAFFHDLNRNFPDGVLLPELGTFADASPLHLSAVQLETQALMRWCSAHNFSASLNLHMGATLVCYPYGNNPGGIQTNTPAPDDSLLQYLAMTYTQANPHMRDAAWPVYGIINAAAWYPIAGEFPDWQYRYLGIQALTVELYRYSNNEGANNLEGKESTNPDHLNNLWNANRNSFIRWLEAAGSGIAITVLDQDSQLPIPTARLAVSTGQPVAASAAGFSHRSLMPGPVEVSVFADGYHDSPPIALSLSAHELFTETIHLSRTSPLRTLTLPQYHRFLPLRRNLLAWRITATEFSPAAAMVSVQIPAGWQQPVLADTTASALRFDANNTFTMLLLAENSSGQLPEQLQTWLTPPDLSTGDHVLTGELEWIDDQRQANQWHWLTAEARAENLTLQNGWNLIGTATGGAPEALTNSELTIWQWQNQTWHLIAPESYEPGTAAWIYSETAQILPLNGWMPHEKRSYEAFGFQPVFSSWPQANLQLPAFRYNRQQQTYEQTFALEQEATWMWQPFIEP